MSLRGFGFTLELGPKGMAVRNWYVGADGIQRWADTRGIRTAMTTEGGE